jgi:hypothetical protein
MPKKPTKSNLNKEAVWTGYATPYIQNIIKGALKAADLLSIITFDPKLMFWVMGLKKHLQEKMAEAEKEKAESLKKYKF